MAYLLEWEKIVGDLVADYTRMSVFGSSEAVSSRSGDSPRVADFDVSVDGSSPPQPLHELEGVTGRICHEEAPDAGVCGILRRLQHLYSRGGDAAVPRVDVLDDPRDHHRLRRGGLVEAV